MANINANIWLTSMGLGAMVRARLGLGLGHVRLGLRLSIAKIEVVCSILYGFHFRVPYGPLLVPFTDPFHRVLSMDPLCILIAF